MHLKEVIWNWKDFLSNFLNEKIRYKSEKKIKQKIFETEIKNKHFWNKKKDFELKTYILNLNIRFETEKNKNKLLKLKWKILIISNKKIL